MGLFNKKTKSKIEKVYLDNADSFSYKENLGKELTFIKKVKSKITALSNGGYYGFI